jgi:Lon protease-like protein
VAHGDARTPKIASVGTLARISVVEMPQLGILHVATVGESRFEVHRYASDPLGLVIGEVTPIPDEPQMPLAESQARLSKLLALIATKLGPDSLPA